MTQKQKTHHIAVAAMLCAVAFVLQFIEFSIPLIPSFVKLDLSDLPALLGTFSLGPVYGVVIQLVKNLLHLPFGSSAGVGELSNFLLGSVFVLVAGLVYQIGPVGLPAGRRADGAGEPAFQLFRGVPGLRGPLRSAHDGHHRDV